jgi:hypothetical protein
VRKVCAGSQSPAGGEPINLARLSHASFEVFLGGTMPPGVAADVRRLERSERHPASLVTSAATSFGGFDLHDSGLEHRTA